MVVGSVCLFPVCRTQRWTDIDRTEQKRTKYSGIRDELGHGSPFKCVGGWGDVDLPNECVPHLGLTVINVVVEVRLLWKRNSCWKELLHLSQREGVAIFRVQQMNAPVQGRKCNSDDATSHYQSAWRFSAHHRVMELHLHRFGIYNRYTIEFATLILSILLSVRYILLLFPWHISHIPSSALVHPLLVPLSHLVGIVMENLHPYLILIVVSSYSCANFQAVVRREKLRRKRSGKKIADVGRSCAIWDWRSYYLSLQRSGCKVVMCLSMKQQSTWIDSTTGLSFNNYTLLCFP